MFTLEDFMNVRDLKQQGLSVSAIARQLDLDRKTVRKHLLEPPQAYRREHPAACKIDPYRSYLRERWEQGVHNGQKLWEEMRERGYAGSYSGLKMVVAPWREEARERAFVRFETGPGEQSQMDWGHFGNWEGRRLYGFGMLLCYSRMRYVEFTQRQDIHHLLECMVHAGKTVVVREPVAGGRIEIYRDITVIAEHRLAAGRGVMVIDAAHYEGIEGQRRPRGPGKAGPAMSAPVGLTPGPGVGRGFVAPEVEQRSLAVYQEVADVAAI